MPPVPIEIIGLIVSELAALDPKEPIEPLLQCSLVSKAFYAVVRPELYRHIHLHVNTDVLPTSLTRFANLLHDAQHGEGSPAPPPNDFATLTRTLERDSTLAAYTRSLSLSFVPVKKHGRAAVTRETYDDIALFGALLRLCPNVTTVSVRNIPGDGFAGISAAIRDSGFTYSAIHFQGDRCDGSRQYAALGDLVYRQKKMQHLTVQLTEDPSADFYLRQARQPLFQLKSLVVCHTNCFQDVSSGSGDTLTRLVLACAVPAKLTHLGQLRTLQLGLKEGVDLAVLETTILSLPVTSILSSLTLVFEDPTAVYPTLFLASILLSLPPSIQHLDVVRVPMRLADVRHMLQDAKVLPNLKSFKFTLWDEVGGTLDELLPEVRESRGMRRVSMPEEGQVLLATGDSE